MGKGRSILRILIITLLVFNAEKVLATPINDFYKSHKNDAGMESRTIPPKMAALIIDDDEAEAIDILKSLSALKYLDYKGGQQHVRNYAKQASLAQGDYTKLLHEEDGRRKVTVFGLKKRGAVRKIIGIVETKTRFVLILGKGKLNANQISYLPSLAQEI